MGFRTKVKDKLSTSNLLLRECLAEFLGTFVLVAFGCGSVAMFVLPPKLSNFMSVNFGWGLGAAFGVWCCAGVTGGHINPAVTLAMWILGRVSAIKIPIYWIGQYLGAFTAAACVFGVYYDALNNFDGGTRQVFGENATAGIWGTYPQDYVSIGSALGDQVLGTTLLVLCVLAVTDKNNSAAYDGIVPLIVGLIITVIGMTFGSNCGYPINPARDLSPRIFTSIAGWGTEVYSAYDYYFWVPIVGPHIGAVCGAWLYLMLVGNHCPTRKDETNDIYVDDSVKNVRLADLKTIPDPVESNERL